MGVALVCSFLSPAHVFCSDSISFLSSCMSDFISGSDQSGFVTSNASCLLFCFLLWLKSLPAFGEPASRSTASARVRSGWLGEHERFVDVCSCVAGFNISNVAPLLESVLSIIIIIKTNLTILLLRLSPVWDIIQWKAKI